MTKFKNLIRESDFHNILNTDCPNQAYDLFIDIIKENHNIAFPLKTFRVESGKLKNQVWITSGFQTSSKNKSKLLQKKLSNPTLQNCERYSKYNICYNKVRRALKKQYYQHTLDKCKHDMKASCKILKSLIGKDSKKLKTRVIFNSSLDGIILIIDKRLR